MNSQFKIEFKPGEWPKWIFLDNMPFLGPPRISYYDKEWGKIALKEGWHDRFLGVKWYKWSRLDF